MSEVKRNSNFEFLRIVSMLLIIMQHFVWHSGFDLTTVGTFNSFLLQLLVLGGKVGVNCFVLISGYFLVKSTKLDFGKFFMLWLQLFVYSTFIYCAFCLFGVKTFSSAELKQRLMPFTFRGWWFASVYLMLFLLAPFINLALTRLKKKAYLTMLCIMLVCWTVIPYIYKQNGGVQLSNFAWFICLYCAAGYFRLFGFPKFFDKCSSIIFAIGLFVLAFCHVYFLDLSGASINFIEMYEPITVAISFFTLMAVGYAKPRYSKAVNLIASTTFGIYLLHDNQNVRGWLWRTVLQCATYQESPYLWLCALISIVLIFVVGMIVNLIYKYTIDLLFRRIGQTSFGKKLHKIVTIQVDDTPVKVDASTPETK